MKTNLRVIEGNSAMPQDQPANPSSTTSVLDLMKYWPIVLWCITSIFALGGIFVKVDNIQKAMERSDNQFAAMNDRQTLGSQALIELRGKVDLQIQSGNQTAKEVAAMNERIVTLERGNRYLPK